MVLDPPFEPTRWSLKLLQSLDWRVFEELCAEIANRRGFVAATTGPGADGGIDIVVRKPEAEEFEIAAQCKRWKRRVGLDPIRAFCFSFADAGFSKGYLVSSRGFTRRALEQFGGRHDLELVDGKRVLRRIFELGPQEANGLLNFATRGGQWHVPTCASCDVKMVRKEPRDGDAWNAFWACPNFGAEGCTFKLRNSDEG